MPLENRVRITLLLPAPVEYAHHVLVDSLITQLVERYSGATHSPLLSEAAFKGAWLAQDDLIADDIIYIFCDAAPEEGQPHEEFRATLLAFLEGLREECLTSFKQLEIWVTINPTQRVVGREPADGRSPV